MTIPKTQPTADGVSVQIDKAVECNYCRIEKAPLPPFFVRPAPVDLNEHEKVKPHQIQYTM